MRVKDCERRALMHEEVLQIQIDAVSGTSRLTGHNNLSVMEDDPIYTNMSVTDQEETEDESTIERHQQDSGEEAEHELEQQEQNEEHGEQDEDESSTRVQQQQHQGNEPMGEDGEEPEEGENDEMYWSISVANSASSSLSSDSNATDNAEERPAVSAAEHDVIVHENGVVLSTTPLPSRVPDADLYPHAFASVSRQRPPTGTAERILVSEDLVALISERDRILSQLAERTDFTPQQSIQISSTIRQVPPIASAPLVQGGKNPSQMTADEVRGHVDTQLGMSSAGMFQLGARSGGGLGCAEAADLGARQRSAEAAARHVKNLHKILRFLKMFESFSRRISRQICFTTRKKLRNLDTKCPWDFPSQHFIRPFLVKSPKKTCSFVAH